MSNSPSITGNFILNLFRVLSAVVLGVCTLPYLNRALGVDNMGKIEYVYTIINYFVLFSALGIPTYGVREIAKNRDNMRQLYKVIYELLIILFCTTILSYIIIFCLIYNLNIFSDYKQLILIMSVMVFLSNIGMEWVFYGIENQRFITIRSLITRSITLVSIFIFIKSESDYYIYAFFLSGLSLAGNFFNLYYVTSRIRKLSFSFSELDIKRHIRPIMTIFIATISINIYVQLDNFLIGLICGDKYVAYYALSNKLIRHSIVIVTIIGSIMLPRLSFLIQKDKDMYVRYLNKTFEVMMILAIPFSIFFFIFASDIILVMGGADFSASILTVKILSPLCIIVSLAYFLGFLVLYPYGLEKIYTKATIYSAGFSIIFNVFMIKYFKQNGAAVTAICCEIVAIAIMLYATNKQVLFKYSIFDVNFLKIISINLSIIVIFGIFKIIYNSDLEFFKFCLAGLTFFGLYGLLLLVFKERNSSELFNQFIVKKIKR